MLRKGIDFKLNEKQLKLLKFGSVHLRKLLVHKYEILAIDFIRLD